MLAVHIPRANLDAYNYGQEDESLFGFERPGADADPIQVGAFGGKLKTVAISKTPKQKKLNSLAHKLQTWASKHRIKVGDGAVLSTSDSDNLVSGHLYYTVSPMESDALGQQAKALAFPHKGIYFYLVPAAGKGQGAYYGVFASDPRVTTVSGVGGISWNGDMDNPFVGALDAVAGEGFFKKLGRGLGVDKESKLARCRKLIAAADAGSKDGSDSSSGLTDEEAAIAQEASDLNLAAAAEGNSKLAAAAAGVILHAILDVYPDGRIVITPLDPSAATDPVVSGLVRAGHASFMGSSMFPLGTGLLPLYPSVNGMDGSAGFQRRSGLLGTPLMPWSDDVAAGMDDESEGFWTDESEWGDANFWAETPGWYPGAEYQDGSREGYWSDHTDETLDTLERGRLLNPRSYHPGYVGAMDCGCGCGGSGACQSQSGAMNMVPRVSNYSRSSLAGSSRALISGGRSAYGGGSGRSSYGGGQQGGGAVYPIQIGTPVYAAPTVIPQIVAYDPLGVPLVYDAFGRLVPFQPGVSGLAGEDVQYPGLGF